MSKNSKKNRINAVPAETATAKGKTMIEDIAALKEENSALKARVFALEQATGIAGAKGEKGDAGVQGAQGKQGEKGAKGGFSLMGN